MENFKETMLTSLRNSLERMGYKVETDSDGVIRTRIGGKLFACAGFDKGVQFWLPLWGMITYENPNLNIFFQILNHVNTSLGGKILLDAPDEYGILKFTTQYDWIINDIPEENKLDDMISFIIEACFGITQTFFDVINQFNSTLPPDQTPLQIQPLYTKK